ncbi:hypothetical protein C8R46DRAFT_1109656 [Mycena filopes]|nr:hypothetical protein C8R46DRAFT_1109656 [Mycena filopes]
MTDSSSFEETTVLLQGPSFHVDLAPIDARHMLYFSRRLIIFRCTSAAQRDAQLAAVKIGIQALLARCPILAGVVVASSEKEGWRNIVPGPGLELVVRDLRGAIPSLDELEAAHFPPRHFVWDLVMPIPRDLSHDRPHAACKLQFSAIEGGTILTFAISHAVADGFGMDALTRILIDATRLAQDSTATPPSGEILGIDRSVLSNMKSDVKFDFEQHPAYRLKSAALPNIPGANAFGAGSSEIPVLLRISPNGLALLKEDATTPGARISTHDALCALMWRTIIGIRHRRSSTAQSVPLSTTSNLFMPTEARRHLNLPPNYVGNVVYQLITAPLDLETLFSPAGLPRAALEIRRAIADITPARVRSYMAHLTDDASSRAIDYQFMNGTAATTGFAMGTCMGSTAVLYGGDWGKAFGPVVAYRLVGDANNVVLPKLPDGTVELLVSVLPEEEEAVRGVEGFGKYLAL